MPNYKIIVNPTSGRGTGEKSIPIIERQLKKYDLDFDLVRTERPRHASELARQAVKDGFEIVVAAGGDGTVNEVLNGLMLAKETDANSVAMGVLTVGRGNDFAFGVNIPHDLEKGCKLLTQNSRVAIDVGRAYGGLYPQGRYFGNGVGIGFDAVVGFEALKLKRLHGFPSYVVAALKTIFLYNKAPLLKIEYDGQAFTQSLLMVSIMNGRRMGGGFMMAPDAENNDGLFDLCIAGEVSRRQTFVLLPKFMKGTQAKHDAVKTGKTAQITVTAVDGVIPAHADGETLCTDGQKLKIEIIPGGIDILCETERRSL